MSVLRLCWYAFALIATAVSASALAQRDDDAARAYPSRPVRVVIGFTPGGQPDIVTRMIAPKLSSALGQQFVIDNRPGAGGVTGTKIVVDAQADGYTLLVSSSSIAISPAVFAKLPFDTVKDLAGISSAYTAAYLLAVTPSLGVKSLAMIAMMAAANRPAELRVHLKSALQNGCTPEEVREVLLLVALYCGIPAANEAHRAAMDVLAEEKKI